MKKERKGKHFIKKAYYKGGSKALTAFVLENLKYPQEAWDNQIEGTVHARYDINHRGKVTKIKIINAVGYGCDEEAKRLIRLLEFEVPKTRGLKLTFHKTIHIHFRMPKQSNEPTIVQEKPSIPDTANEMTINYEIKSTPKKETTNPKTSGGTHYTYTVDI